MLQEFKKFILRGNVVDLAVAVAVGAAFSAVVSAFVADFVNPLLALIPGNTNLAGKSLHLGAAEFKYGHFMNNVITFLLTAAVLFFVVIQPLNRLMELSRKRQATADPTTRKCPECLGEIPIKAKRCMYCTVVLKAES